MGIKVIDDSGFDIELCAPEFEASFRVDAQGDVEMGDSYAGRNDAIALAKHFNITAEEIEGFEV